MNYDSLALDNAWRRFEKPIGNAQAAFERHIRAFEKACQTLNLTPETVHIATEIASHEPSLEPDDRIALIAIILISFAASQQGSTQFPLIGPISKVPMQGVIGTLCGDSGPAFIEQMIARIEMLISQNFASEVIGYHLTDYKPMLFTPPCIVHHRINHAERELARMLGPMLKVSTSPKPVDAQVRSALDKVLARPTVIAGVPILPSYDQRQAILAASRKGLTTISGGPGTGKTSIIVAIIRLMVRLGVSPSQIALAAPTGKAAYRMGESIREALSAARECERDEIDQAIVDAHLEPATIHRLLGYSPESNRFRHHKNNQLVSKVVIIDECSMLDLTLMERLAAAIQPDARLILLGDADQLPSVAAGSVFRDLVKISNAATAGASIRLQENHRMKKEDASGRSILRAANAINQGEVDLFYSSDLFAERIATRKSSPTDLAFKGFEFLSAKRGELGNFLDHWYDRRSIANTEFNSLLTHQFVQRDSGFDSQDCDRLRQLFAHVAKSRILCATRVFESGSDRINARFHARAAAAVGVSAARVDYVVGEPLIVLRNDYQRGLFNGDQGLRLWICRGNRAQVPMAVFPRGDDFVAFHFDTLSEHLELAYAMTVHKAQGSEFDSVALVLPEDPTAVLTRELIYTAVSRARNSVVVVGDEARLMEAIASPVERFSGLADLIAAELAR